MGLTIGQKEAMEVLSDLASGGEGATFEDLRSSVSYGEERLRYHLGRLRDKGYVDRSAMLRQGRFVEEFRPVERANARPATGTFLK